MKFQVQQFVSQAMKQLASEGVIPAEAMPTPTIERTRDARHGDFAWVAEGPKDWRFRGDDGPATRFETKAIEQGRSPAYLRFRRRPR